MDRANLMIELHAGRERLRAALASLSDAAMLDRVDDEWTRKDVLAHIGAWERRFVELLERLRHGDWPDDADDTDALNARYYLAARDTSLDVVRLEEEAAWSRFLAAVESMSDAELFDPRRFPWTQGDPLVDWVSGNANGHVDEHLDQLTRPARIDRRAARPRVVDMRIS
jgi:hypothetical protein